MAKRSRRRDNRYKAQRFEIQRHPARRFDVLNHKKKVVYKSGYKKNGNHSKINGLDRLRFGLIRANQVTHPKSTIKNRLQSVTYDAILSRKEAICRERRDRRRSIFRIGRAGKGVAGPTKKVIDLIKSRVRCK